MFLEFLQSIGDRKGLPLLPEEIELRGFQFLDDFYCKLPSYSSQSNLPGGIAPQEVFRAVRIAKLMHLAVLVMDRRHPTIFYYDKKLQRFCIQIPLGDTPPSVSIPVGPTDQLVRPPPKPIQTHDENDSIVEIDPPNSSPSPSSNSINDSQSDTSFNFTPLDANTNQNENSPPHNFGLIKASKSMIMNVTSPIPKNQYNLHASQPNFTSNYQNPNPKDSFQEQTSFNSDNNENMQIDFQTHQNPQQEQFSPPMIITNVNQQSTHDIYTPNSSNSHLSEFPHPNFSQSSVSDNSFLSKCSNPENLSNQSFTSYFSNPYSPSSENQFLNSQTSIPNPNSPFYSPEFGTNRGPTLFTNDIQFSPWNFGNFNGSSYQFPDSAWSALLQRNGNDYQNTRTEPKRDANTNFTINNPFFNNINW